MSLLTSIVTGPRPGPRRIMIYGTAGIGKCLSGTTTIYDPITGRPRRLDRVVEEQSGAITALVPGGMLQTRHPSHYMHNPDAELFRITTQTGRVIEATAHHPFLTTAGWTPLCDLAINQRIGVVAHYRNLFGSTRTDEASLKILAYLITDGNLGGSSPIFTKIEDEVRLDFEDAVEAAGCDFREFVNGEGIAHVRVRGALGGENNVLQFLRDIGLHGLRAKDKFIPEFIFGLTRDRLALFLNRMFTCDGCAEQRGYISYSSTSIQMVRQIQHLLLRFGIVSTFRNKYLDGLLYGAELLIGSRDDLIRFIDQIGFFGQKAIRAEDLRAKAIQVRNPGSTHLHRHGDVLFDRILSIEPVGVAPVYDLTIPEVHNFVADDVIVHNSTFATCAPTPIVVQTEDGLGGIDCHRFPVAQSLDEVMASIAALYQERHDYRTVVIDSLDWMERLIHSKVCSLKQVASIEDIGYGKGYTFALSHWRDVLDGLSALRDQRGLTVILIAHAKIERFENPETEAYDRYMPRLHKTAAALVSEWCDEVLFAGYRVFTKATDEGFNRTRVQGLGSGERVIRTTERPAHLAKNRLNLPDELPLAWSEFARFLPGAAPQTATPVTTNP